jgi:type VI protein secretion system component Hcp
VSFSPAGAAGEIGAGGAGAKGKHDFSELSASKKADASSPLLWKHAHEGRHVPTVEIVAQKGGKTALTIKIKTRRSARSGSTARAIETFVLKFAEVEFEYGEKAK